MEGVEKQYQGITGKAEACSGYSTGRKADCVKCTLRGGKEMAERKVSRFESNMESFGAWIEKYVAPPLVKFGKIGRAHV